jgi:hypothetical protein
VERVGGLFLGILIGLGCGIPFFHALDELGKSFENLKGDRTSELLVKYHDMLVDLARSENNSPPPEQAGQGRAGGSRSEPTAAFDP